eukprot:TRINITY_DN24773_c0_g1_i1.p1 TRINITY_DN24773_c0_g1~~TRINITY_DN24773_c0_g1_i1.p1  ORF type:complete len:361 (-),score=32.94 TRINITY_DN24773_c0_g1_i1:295-1377(-)
MSSTGSLQLSGQEDEDIERQVLLVGTNIEQKVAAFGIGGVPCQHPPAPAPVPEEDSQSMYDDETSTSSEPLLIVKSFRAESFLWIRNLFLLAILFSVSFSMVFALFMSLPRLESLQDGHLHRTLIGVDGQTEIDKLMGGEIEEPLLLIKFPKDINQLRVVRKTLLLYQKEYRSQVQIGIVALYLFLQAFMIPGTIFLNILAGSLYGFYEALVLVTVLAALGSSFCYFLSNCILKEIVYYYFPDRCEWFAREVHRHRHNLLNYILFLRLTPLLPNWFINVGAPLVSIPFREFFIGTIIGLMPASVIAVKAGSILSQINSLGDLYDWKTIATLFFIAFLSILPVVLKTRLDRFRSGFSLKTR